MTRFSSIVAAWNCSLDTVCPRCQEPLNLCDDPEWLAANCIAVGEHNTANTRGREVTCIYCNEAFLVDLYLGTLQ